MQQKLFGLFWKEPGRFHARKLLFYNTGKGIAFALVQYSGWRGKSDWGSKKWGCDILSCDNLSRTFDHVDTLSKRL